MYVSVERNEGKKYLEGLGVDVRIIQGHCFIGQLALTVQTTLRDCRQCGASRYFPSP
jgi:hypothetical protein